MTPPLTPAQPPLPCPFCGNTKIVVQSNGIGDYYCICGDADYESGCGARSDDYRCEDQRFAVERWNRRAPSLAPERKGEPE